MNNDYERYNFWHLELPKIKEESNPEIKDSNEPKQVAEQPVEINH